MADGLPAIETACMSCDDRSFFDTDGPVEIDRCIEVCCSPGAGMYCGGTMACVVKYHEKYYGVTEAFYDSKNDYFPAEGRPSED